MTTFYDLSVPLEDTPSEPLKVTIQHLDHVSSAAQMARFLEVRVEDLTGGMGWATDDVHANTHAGTHVDAPWHYYPTSMGAPARRIDEMPLEWFFQDGVRLDFRHMPQAARIEVSDLEAALAAIDYTLKPLDIVMLRTGTDKLWGSDKYMHGGAGLTAESTLWLLDRGVRVIGTDCWGLDRPLWAAAKQFKEDNDPAKLWEAHRAGIEQEYCQIEKLANLESLPTPFGFKVSCFPVKVKGGSAGWTRVVAIYE